MITTGISLVLATLTFILVSSFLGMWSAMLPSIAVLIITFIVISRRISQALQKEMTTLQEDLMKGHVDKALLHMADIQKRYGKWQFFLSSTMDGQIGTIYYLKNQHAKAKPYLERAFGRHWVAKAMLGVIYYREKKMAECDKVFKETTRMVKKTGLLWSVWAYCHWRNGDINGAINILAKGKEHLKDADPLIISNLLLLQNDKRMKMKGYGEQWYQFQLELSPQQTQMKQGRLRFKAR
jgi:tetratricopeptide (TPR) repeat protein